MSIEVTERPERTSAELANGILVDLEHLVEQQLLLMRRELEREFRKYAVAVRVIALGIGLLLLDAAVLCLSLAHLMHWMASPVGADPSSIPLWACYAAISIVLSVLCAAMIFWGRSKFRTANVNHVLSSNISEEDVPWTTNQK
jgi:hypothetical protein